MGWTTGADINLLCKGSSELSVLRSQLQVLYWFVREMEAAGEELLALVQMEGKMRLVDPSQSTMWMV